MTHTHEGGCLCGDVRYRVTGDPLRVTVCHCTFCQRVTGTAFLVEPIIGQQNVALAGAPPKTYDHVSDGSGKRVTVNFCGRCGTALFYAFERFPDVLGLFAGTFDNPNWFERSPANTRHIFTRSAQKGVVLPAGIKLYEAHATAVDGTANTPTVLTEPRIVE